MIFKFKLYQALLVVVLIIACKSKADSIKKDTNSGSISQVPRRPNSEIYLGKILGVNSINFNKKPFFEKDTAYGLRPITKSKYPIEIRFYYTSSWSDTSSCTILYYDSIFHIKRIKSSVEYSATKERMNLKKIYNRPVSVKANPDSIFSKLVENGIFSLQQFDKKDYAKLDAKILRNGLMADGIIVGEPMDGTATTLSFKIDSLYNTIYMNGPDGYFMNNPDYQPFRRYFGIAVLMLSK